MADDVTPISAAPNRLLNVPEVPPASWFNEDPPGHVLGQTLHVAISGPNEGRCIGLIQPPKGRKYSPGKSGRRHRNWGRGAPDARFYPDGMRTFNRGPLLVTDDAGAERKIQVGKLTIRGGHAQQAIGASSIREAVDWLHREGPWAETPYADDVALVGRAEPVEDPQGIYTGAVLFRGVVMPGTTLRDAMEINSTTMSAEVWEDPEFEGKMVFAGATRVDTTAWPYDVPEAMAAEVDEETDCEGPFCVVFAASGNSAEEAPPVAPQSTPTDSVDQGDPDAPVITRGQCEGCGGCTCGKLDQAQATIPTTANGLPIVMSTQTKPKFVDVGPDAAPDVVAAEGDDVAAALATEQLAAVQTEQADLRKMIEDLAVEVAEITVTVFGAEGLGSANQLDEMTQQINDLREQVIELLQKIPTAQRESDTDGDRPGNQSITPGPPLGNSAVNQGAIRDLQGALRG